MGQMARSTALTTAQLPLPAARPLHGKVDKHILCTFLMELGAG